MQRDICAGLSNMIVYNICIYIYVALYFVSLMMSPSQSKHFGDNVI